MAIRVRLGGDLYKHYLYAMTKAKAEVTGDAPIVELTAENFDVTIDVLKALHAKTFAYKTKSIVHMERLFSLERIINEVSKQAIYFPKPTANNDAVDEAAGKDAA